MEKLRGEPAGYKREPGIIGEPADLAAEAEVLAALAGTIFPAGADDPT